MVRGERMDEGGYCNMIAPEQKLSFSQLLAELKLCGAELGSLEPMLKRDGMYTNTALLLSDQCKHTLRCTSFIGTDQISPKEQTVFTGSVARQARLACEWARRVLECGQKKSKIPYKAVAETIINAVIHRDYSFSGSTLCSIFSDRCEVVSLGGVIENLSVDDLRMGVSASRNPMLAEIFASLRLARLCGQGFAAMNRCYGVGERRVLVRCSESVFSATVPARSKKVFQLVGKKHDSSKSQQLVIRKHLSEKGTVSRVEVQQLLGVGQTRALNIIKTMLKNGVIHAEGFGKKTVYKLT